MKPSRLACVVTVTALLAWLAAAQEMSSGVRLGVLATAVVGSAVCSVRAERDGIRAGEIVGAGAVLLVAAVLFPPRESNDLWGYVSYARVLSEHGSNPYVTPPSAFPEDPLLGRMSAEYRDDPSVYGPLFTLYTAGITAAAGERPTALRISLQATAAIAALLVVLEVRRRSGGEPRSVAFVALNPLLVVTVNGAHPDMAAGALVLAGVLTAESRRPARSGLLLGLAALTKLTAGMAAVGVLAWKLRQRHPKEAAMAAAALLAVVVAGYGIFGGSKAVEPLQQVALRGTRSQAWEILRKDLTADAEAKGAADPRVEAHEKLRTPGLVATVLFLGVGAVGLSRRRRVAEAAAGSALAGLVASRYVLPWYLANVLPTSALVSSSAVGILVWAEAARQLLVYADPPGRSPPEGWLEQLSTHWLPLVGVALAAAVLWHSLRSPRDVRRPEPTSADRRAVTGIGT
ncbi:MAG: hypothetical protein KatS3mg008_1753 [Acidimicrobiales bacterium]|nr:MAG: hypothetical protein KatS3mg008_1753 [Acidimicrobiales bacterium]